MSKRIYRTDVTVLPEDIRQRLVSGRLTSQYVAERLDVSSEHASRLMRESGARRIHGQWTLGGTKSL